ncbi:hypothetical protein FACS1894199_00790 [Bacteroidia bacterium]|nr:hypothetical protein FACS1894199_00790 [Bacteroidia bacterium]
MAKPVNKKAPQPHRSQVIQGKKVVPPRNPQVAPKNPATPQSSLKQWILCAIGLKSMLLAVVVGLLLYVGIKNNSGYQWAFVNYLKGNWDFIQAHDTLTVGEIYQMKCGFNYTYLNYIKQHTPDSAIILFPLKEHLTEKGGDMQLGGEIGSKMWATHFVYPRRILYKEEAETNPLYKDVTHVAIVAAHGYDDLDYFVQQRAYFDVLPKHVDTAPR